MDGAGARPRTVSDHKEDDAVGVGEVLGLSGK
jgi:hypothetical protein